MCSFSFIPPVKKWKIILFVFTLKGKKKISKQKSWNRKSGTNLIGLANVGSHLFTGVGFRKAAKNEFGFGEILSAVRILIESFFYYLLWWVKDSTCFDNDWESIYPYKLVVLERINPKFRKLFIINTVSVPSK